MQPYSRVSLLQSRSLLAHPTHRAFTSSTIAIKSKSTSICSHSKSALTPTNSSAQAIFPCLLRQRASPLSASPITTRRHASTAPAASQSAQSAPTASSETSLTWNDFLRLRRIRRYYNLGASIGTSITTLVTGMGVMSQQNLQTLSQQLFGLDPFVLLGLCATSFWGIGWLMGPLVGTSVFQLLNRSKTKGMAAKEKDFFKRIKKYRVDPSSSSMQNPPPDYYGEKITSVAGYRRWLKDQRAFNKKRQRFL